MGAGERPAAGLAVDGRALRAVLPRSRTSPSSPSAGGRRSRARLPSMPLSTWSQPRKMSLLACIRCWPATTRSPWFAYWLLAVNSSSTEDCASLNCRNSGSLLVSAEHQHDPRAGADAADPDDLAGHVDQSVLLQQDSPVGLQRLPVPPQKLVQLARRWRSPSRPGARSWIRSISGGSETICGSPSTIRVSLENAVMLSFVRAFATVFSALFVIRFFSWPAQLRHELVDLEPGVPHVQRAHAGELLHRLAIARDRLLHDRSPLLARVPVLASGHLEAHRQPLHVPLPRPRKRLVEVVQIEHQPPIRRREQAEVRQMRITAQLGVQPGIGARRQVRRHQQRRTAVERERRHQHPPVPDRHQLRHPRLRLRLQESDRIRTMRRRRDTRRDSNAAPPPAPPAPAPPAPPRSDAAPHALRAAASGRSFRVVVTTSAPRAARSASSLIALLLADRCDGGRVTRRVVATVVHGASSPSLAHASACPRSRFGNS